MKTTPKLLLALPISLVALAANGAMIMPDLANVPTGWTTDRYEPASFSNVGTYQGRDNVLGIGIAYPGTQPSTFSNTQGRQHAVSGGAGSVLSADLYIPTSWGNAANGSVRTDIWGVMQNVGGGVTAYPILGFSNYGGAPRLRAFDGDVAGGWVDLMTASFSYDAWNTLAVEFTGSSFKFSVNGSSLYEDSTIDATTGFKAVIMQAYNFDDPTISGANLVGYTAHWSNTPVPEPSTYVAGALLLLPFGISTLRMLRKKQTA